MIKYTVFALLLLQLFACAGPVSDTAWQMPASAPEKLPFPFSVKGNADHPLVGHFWSVKEQRLVSVHEFLAELPPGGWLLMGELHDHPDHQSFEAIVLAVLAKSGRLGRVAMEQLGQEQQPLLEPWYGKGNLVGGHDLNWNPKAWNWMSYREPLSRALNHADKVLAANPNRAHLDGAYKGELKLLQPSDAHRRVLMSAISDGHCGKLPDSFTEPMSQVQLAKDQFMAETLLANRLPAKVGVLLAGLQHSRNDYGVPLWLERMSEQTNKSSAHLSLIMMPVGQQQDPRQYLKTQIADRPAADYLFFTPSLPAKDYCAQLEGAPRHK